MPLEAHSRRPGSVPRAIGLVLPATCLNAALPLALALGMSTAAAQDGAAVYRCPDGQYRQSPCPGGRPVDTGAPPTAQQQAEAKRAAATEARLADELRRERHARERAATGQAPARIGPAPTAASQPGKHHTKKKPKRTKDRAPADAQGERDSSSGGGSGSGARQDAAKSRKAYGPAKPGP